MHLFPQGNQIRWTKKNNGHARTVSSKLKGHLRRNPGEHPAASAGLGLPWTAEQGKEKNKKTLQKGLTAVRNSTT